MELEPYLFFNGLCENALNAYTTILGGEVQGLTRYSEMPPGQNPQVTPETANRVMHARFSAPGIAFMASDGNPQTKYGEGQISLSLSVQTRAEAERIFNAFAAGGKVDMALQNTFWGAYFGMVTDKFGIDWMISSPQDK
jgi:PhnB protein